MAYYGIDHFIAGGLPAAMFANPQPYWQSGTGRLHLDEHCPGTSRKARTVHLIDPLTITESRLCRRCALMPPAAGPLADTLALAGVLRDSAYVLRTAADDMLTSASARTLHRILTDKITDTTNAAGRAEADRMCARIVARDSHIRATVTRSVDDWVDGVRGLSWLPRHQCQSPASVQAEYELITDVHRGLGRTRLSQVRQLLLAQVTDALLAGRGWSGAEQVLADVAMTWSTSAELPAGARAAGADYARTYFTFLRSELTAPRVAADAVAAGASAAAVWVRASTRSTVNDAVVELRDRRGASLTRALAGSSVDEELNVLTAGPVWVRLPAGVAAVLALPNMNFRVKFTVAGPAYNDDPPEMPATMTALAAQQTLTLAQLPGVARGILAPVPH